jgi:hypothetical protein
MQVTFCEGKYRDRNFNQHTAFSTAEGELVTSLVKLDNTGYGLDTKKSRAFHTTDMKHSTNSELQMSGKAWVWSFMNRHTV